jgi:hypothetical protein
VAPYKISMKINFVLLQFQLILGLLQNNLKEVTWQCKENMEFGFISELNITHTRDLQKVSAPFIL